MSLPSNVTIYEVGPRDGLQNEKKTIDTDVKIDLINRLSQAGLKKIEATACVSPKWVPQMADHSDVLQQIKRKDGVTYPVLVPNDKGFDAAKQAGATEIAIFGAASETFSQKNINASIAESLERFDSVVKKALDARMGVRAYISCVAGCPYEGEVALEKTADMAKAFHDMGCYEISLGDTIGVGTPNKISAIFEAVTKHVPIEKLALHCHDTYGMAIANIAEGLRHGVQTIDSSVGGLGGCPYAPGAAGNVATEDVIYLLNGLGIEHGVNAQKIVEIADFISQKLGRPLSSKSGQALLASCTP